MKNLQLLLTKGFEVLSLGEQSIYTLEVSNKKDVQKLHTELFGYENSEVESLVFEVTEDLENVNAFAVGSEEYYAFEDINELMMFL